MDIDREKFRRFNKSNLKKAIYSVVKCEKQMIKNEFESVLWDRLDFLRARNNRIPRYFIFEEDYVETEWKEMVKIHYVNTSYDTQNTVMRIHVFQEPKFSEECYLGFFTLRKINEIKIMLSYIYPNWRNIRYHSKKVWVMTYKKKVHYMGKELTFNTYPLFVQDNITVACAQASMVSMTQYLHNKYDYPKVHISELNGNILHQKKKLFPTDGLAKTQIIETFNYYNISIEFQQYEDENDREYIDHAVESALPVLLGLTFEDNEGNINRHVVQIIGYVDQKEQAYVIYDDSGFLLKNLLGRNGFVACVEWGNLKKHVRPKQDFWLYPIHEKVYTLYDGFMSIVRKQIENCESARCLLADNREIKKFINEKIVDNDAVDDLTLKNAIKILSVSLPHYVWYYEVPYEDKYKLYIANPTLHHKTAHDIFYNSEPLISKSRFNLLDFE